MPPSERQTERRTFLALCAAGALAGCSGNPGPAETDTPTSTEPTTTTTGSKRTEIPREAQPGSWSAFGYDATNCGYNPNSGPVPKTEQSWSTSVPGYYTLPTPTVSDIGVYMGSKGSIFAMDRKTGLNVWRERLAPYTHMFTPTTSDGTLYGVSRGLAGADSGSGIPGKITAVDERSGETLWTQSALVSSSPTVHNGSLFHAAAGRTSGSIVARSTDDGTEEWTVELAPDGTAGSFGTPAVIDDTVFGTGWANTGGDSKGVLLALDPQDGTERWRHEISETVKGSPVVDEETVILPGSGGTVYAVSIADQTTRWTQSIGEGIYARPAIGPDHIYTVSEGTLTALDKDSGTPTWTAPVGESHFSEIAVAGGAVFVGGDVLYSYAAESGELRWHKEVPGYAGAWGGPAVVNGDMYVGVCIKEEAGSLYDNYVYYLDG